MVSWMSVPPLVMAGIAAFVGLHHLFLYWRVRHLQASLSFGCLCLCVASYSVFCALVYGARIPEAAAGWQVMQAMAISAGALVFIWFVGSYVGQPVARLEALLAIVYLPVVLAPLVGRSDLLVTHQREIKQFRLPFGLVGTYNEMAIGPLFDYANLLSAIVYGYCFMQAWRLFTAGEKTKARSLLITAALFYFGGLNDMLISLGIYRSMYLIEYAFIAMVVLMTFSLATELSRTATIEEALRDSERSYREIFDATSDAIVVHDRAHGRVLDINRAMLDLYGYTREEALALSLADLTDPSANALSAAAFGQVQSAVDAEQPKVFEWLARRKDGSRFWAEAALRCGRIAGHWCVLAVVRNITDRKRTARALEESEERYRSLVEASPTGIVLVSEAASLLFANPAAIKMAGARDRDELVGKSIADLVVPEDREDVLVRLAGAFASGRKEVPLTVRVRRADGELRLIELVGRPVLHEGMPAMLAVGHDVTERVRGEEELTRLEEQLRHAQKMEAVGRLAGGVAHDFNNLLQAILSCSEALRAEVGQPDKLRDGLAELGEHARRGAGLSRQLLLFSRQGSTRREQLDLGDTVAGAVSLVTRLLRENVKVDLQLAGVALPIAADRGQIEQVVLNLVVNSADAMPGGGVVAIRTGTEDAHSVWFEVLDTGHGVQPEIRERIFEPFFTTKPVGHASGLGLSVAHGIIAGHGGRIDLRSEVGRGSTFRVTLPRAARVVESMMQRVDLDREGLAPGVEQRVLVVEDEPAAREALGTILTLLGYQVTTAGSGEAALVLPAAPAFDVLLSDVLLPGIPGPELAQVLSARWPDLVVILMSGYAQDELLRAAVENGDVRFLHKPFDMATLSHELTHALSEKGGRRAARIE